MQGGKTGAIRERGRWLEMKMGSMPSDSPRLLRRLRMAALPLVLAACATGTEAQVGAVAAVPTQQLTYADLATLPKRPA